MDITAQNIAVLVLSVPLGAGLLIGLVYLRADFEVDRFRQQMFFVRDELFDFADAGYLAFHDPAYLHLRNLLNALIRFAHRLTFWRILVLFALDLLFDVQPTASFLAEFQASLAAIPDHAVREQMQAFHTQAGRLIRVQLLRSSILLWPILFFEKHTGERPRPPAPVRTTIWIEQQALLTTW